MTETNRDFLVNSKEITHRKYRCEKKSKNSFYSVTLRSIVCKIAIKLIIHHPIQPNTIGQKYTFPRLYLKPYLGKNILDHILV